MKAAPPPAARRRIRLLIVDDHEVVRAGLRALFDEADAIDVAGTAGTAAEAIRAARRLSPDVVLMDLRLPDDSGISACREILSQRPATRVLFLTAYADEEAAAATLLGGAGGYLLKDIGYQSLERAIQAVAAGHSIIDSRMQQPTMQRIRALLGPGAKRRHTDLSPQERRILQLVVQGKTNRQIASALNLSAKTVKNYLSNAFQKLHVGRRAHAAAIFMRRQADAGS